MFGFGKGKVEIALEGYQFAPGDSVRGTATMTLKKPVDARGFRVGLVGQERVTQRTDRGSQTTTQTVFEFKQPVDGEKTYGAGSHGPYRFEIKIPTDVARRLERTGTAGAVMDSLEMLSGRLRSVRWYIVAELDVPKGTDVSKRVQVNVV